jgi:hypothetical protein
MRIAWMRKETTRVPRRRAPTLRMMMEKTMAPAKKVTMEISDFNQPQGLLVG